MAEVKEKKEFEEKIVEVSRVSRTVQGGRRMRFRVLVAIGNHNGKIGFGIGKANEVALAAQKAVTEAKKNILTIRIVKETIPHEVVIKYGSAKLILLPASAGTSIIAGGAVRPIIELVGIKNILSKIIGSSNKINNVKATIEALKQLSEERIETSLENKEIKIDNVTPQQSSAQLSDKEAKNEETEKENNESSTN